MSGLIPYPCPTVSADHKNRMSRGADGAVRNAPRAYPLRAAIAVLEVDAQENLPIGPEPTKIHASGEIRFRCGDGPDDSPRVAETFIGCILDNQAGRPVRSRPHDRPI